MTPPPADASARDRRRRRAADSSATVVRVPHPPVVLEAGWGSSWCATRLLEAGALRLRRGAVTLVHDPTGLLAGPLLRAVVHATGARPCTLATRAGYWDTVAFGTVGLSSSAGALPDTVPVRGAPTLRHVAEPAPLPLPLPAPPPRTLAVVLPAPRSADEARRIAPGRRAPSVTALPTLDVPAADVAAWLAAGAAVLAVQRAPPPAASARIDVLLHIGDAFCAPGDGRRRSRAWRPRPWRAPRHPPPLPR